MIAVVGYLGHFMTIPEVNARQLHGLVLQHLLHIHLRDPVGGLRGAPRPTMPLISSLASEEDGSLNRASSYFENDV